jgi:Na+-transporting NADH:ubiquinone oxidoreductase subunit F
LIEAEKRESEYANKLITMSFFGFIIIGSFVFLIVILLLAKLLLYIKAKRTFSRPVKILINDKKEIKVTAGSSLLLTLANEDIFLPSVCGGGGTCTMCKCQVIDGGGAISSVENEYFTYKQQLNHWRLGCQVKVRKNMKIYIPEESFRIKK